MQRIFACVLYIDGSWGRVLVVVGPGPALAVW